MSEIKNPVRSLMQTINSLMIIILNRDIRCRVPFNTIFNHGGVGVIIGKNVKLGGYCIIGPNVTIGERHGKHPRLGWGVVVCANACIIGDVRVGTCSVIGAGAVVLHNVPPWTIVAGNPAHVIKQIGHDEYLKYRGKRS